MGGVLFDIEEPRHCRLAMTKDITGLLRRLAMTKVLVLFVIARECNDRGDPVITMHATLSRHIDWIISPSSQ